MPPSHVGRTFGRFRVLEHIGAGGMGEVYRARDEHLNRDVAIKFVSSGPQADGRGLMRREAHALSKLNHPNIATVYDFGHEDGVDFVVMEFIVGRSLAQRLAEGPLAPEEAIGVARQIAAGLQEAHEHGVVHRDLKPGNIMMTTRGQVKLVDFGLAWQAPDLEAATMTSLDPWTVGGTLPYMAPEQVSGEPADERTDIWAFGVLLFELVTGERPFKAANPLLLAERILNGEPPRPRAINPAVPARLDSLILGTLEKSPGHRFQTMAEVAALLAPDEYRGDHDEAGSGAANVGTSRGLAAPRRRRRGMAGAALVALALALVFGGRFVQRGAEQSAPKLSVLVADTVNRTGEAAFDETIVELLSTSLGQSRFLALYPRTRVAHVLGLMRRDPDTAIDQAVGREICQREGLSALVTSSVSRLGDAYVLVVSVEEAEGRSLGSTRQVFDRAADLPARIDDAVRELRAHLGESAGSIQAHTVPLADVTSASLDAVRFYTLARQRLQAGDPENAIVLFRQALEFDPDFAMAHEYIGVAYTNLQDPVRAEPHLARAVELVDRLPAAERHKILADYNMLRRNYDEACSHLQVLVELRPLDPTSFLSLGWCKGLTFDYAGALAATRQGLEMQPTLRARVNLARLLFLAGDADQALVRANELRLEQPASLQVHYVAAQAELALLRLDDAARTYETMVKIGDSEVEGRLGLADLALARGRRAEARVQLEAARQAAERQGNELAAGRASVALAELALTEDRRADFDRLVDRLDGTDNRILLFLLGRACARAGRMVNAAAILQESPAAAWPAADRALAALLRAEVAMAREDAPAAIQEADAAWGLEPSVLARETQARAYAAAGRYTEAVRYLDDVLARRTERIDSYDAPGFHRVIEAEYRLGVLLDDLGEHDRARAHLESFLKSRAGADAGLEMETGARRRLARRP